jgi:hypothetical protein
MEPHNESDLLQLANAKDGTYLMTVREIGRNRELATPLNGFNLSPTGAYHVNLPQTLHPDARWHADHAFENGNGYLRQI